MTGLDANRIREALGDDAVELEVFAEIESTNSYLVDQPAPDAARIRVAVTDNQTAGRGRQGKTWLSPPGAGLCLSMAYTFVGDAREMSALTLAIGLSVIDTLAALGIDGVQLKWPNDLIAGDGKLGGILTEAQPGEAGRMTVVTGVGINLKGVDALDLGSESGGALRPVDLAGYAEQVPSAERLAAELINGLQRTFAVYDASGFVPFGRRWPAYDWLYGRELTVEWAKRRITGVAAGIADDGALLVDTLSMGEQRVTSGTVVAVGSGGSDS